LFVFLVLQCQKTEAASAPLSHSFALPALDTGLNNSHVLTPSFYGPQKKVGFIKKLQYRILQKRLKYLSNKPDEGTRPKTNVLSIVSLVLGLIGVIGLFAGIFLLALIPALAALITGLIALGKRNNNKKGSREMAIMGLIIGGGVILLFFLFIISSGAGS
jgi:hypothetical protein